MKKLIPILLSALMFTGCAGTSNNHLSVDMLLGRLECIPIIMMLAPSMWIKKLY